MKARRDRDDVREDQRQIRCALDRKRGLRRLAGEDGFGIRMLKRMTLPTAMASAQTPTIAITEWRPTAPARIGTMIRKPLPKIDASGVVVALVSELDCVSFLYAQRNDFNESLEPAMPAVRLPSSGPQDHRGRRRRPVQYEPIFLGSPGAPVLEDHEGHRDRESDYRSDA